MTSRPPRQDELLQRVLVGDVPGDAPEVQAEKQRDPAFQAGLEHLQDLTQLLDATAAEEREILDEIRSSSSRPLVDAAQVLPPASARRPARTAWLWLPPLAIAASLLLAVTLLLIQDRPRLAPDGPLLGGPRLQCLSPTGEVSEYGTFRWSADSLTVATFELRIYGAGAARPIHVERRLHGTEWSYQPTRHPALPDRLHWEVSAYDETGGLLESSSASASRSPSRR